MGDTSGLVSCITRTVERRFVWLAVATIVTVALVVALLTLSAGSLWPAAEPIIAAPFRW